MVLADVDLRSPRQLKVISYSSAHETRERRNGLPAYPGKFGPYWWLTANALRKGRLARVAPFFYLRSAATIMVPIKSAIM